MRIRPAEVKDTTRLQRLAASTYTAAFAHSMLPSDLAEHLQQNLSVDRIADWIEQDSVLLAETKKMLIGFIQFGDVEGDAIVLINNTQAIGKDQEIRRLYVHSNYQNRSLGTALMNSALKQLRLKLAGNIFLDVWQDNLGAQRFYRRYGFETVGKRTFEVASGAPTTPDLIMCRKH